MWKSPDSTDLRHIVGSARHEILLCSPYISRAGLHVVDEAIPDSVRHVEVWTRLSPEDFLTGSSQPDGLLDFIDSTIQGAGRTISLRQSSVLHAKMILSDGPEGIAGSSNLTAGGYGRNLEVVRVVSGPELGELRAYANWPRSRLTMVSLESFRDFTGACLAKVDSQEALLDLIRTEILPPVLGPGPLIPYGEYLKALERSSVRLAADILMIARNSDHNNNGGKVKHAFYGVQRFLQEYPQHMDFVKNLPPDEWFDVAHSPIEDDWRAFLLQNEAEDNEAYQYSLATLRRTYLTPSSGGTLVGGGGGVNELKRVWASVGRLVAGLEV
jgi:hypothetical protein